MRRPWMVTTAAAIESLLGIALICVAAYMFVVLNKAGELWGLIILFAGGFGLAAVLVIISCWGLWQGKTWGWWLALVLDSVGLVAFLWDPLARRVWPDPDELAFIILFVVQLGLLLLGPVRGFFSGPKE